MCKVQEQSWLMEYVSLTNHQPFNSTTLYCRRRSRNRRRNYWNCLCCKERIRWNINTKTCQTRSDDYEDQYLRRQGQRPTRNQRPEVFSRYYGGLPKLQSPKVKSKSKKPNPFCEECGSKIAWGSWQ